MRCLASRRLSLAIWSLSSNWSSKGILSVCSVLTLSAIPYCSLAAAEYLLPSSFMLINVSVLKVNTTKMQTGVDRITRSNKRKTKQMPLLIYQRLIGLFLGCYTCDSFLGMLNVLFFAIYHCEYRRKRPSINKPNWKPKIKTTIGSQILTRWVGFKPSVWAFIDDTSSCCLG